MRITDLTPNEYWSTDVIDLELGKAVQDAWREGQESASQGHKAEQEALKARAERYGGGAQC